MCREYKISTNNIFRQSGICSKVKLQTQYNKTIFFKLVCTLQIIIKSFLYIKPEAINNSLSQSNKLFN